MKREIDMSEISDGKLYTANDMVRADFHDCEGCSACCKGMGNSIILDPLDVWRLCNGLSLDFDGLMERCLELHVVDGMILPNLRMDGEGEACTFLDEQGRCAVHPYRPGICRLFPLGRYYEEEGFKYFLQVHECRKKDRGKIKVKKWVDAPDLKAYEKYIFSWHDFLRKCEEGLNGLDEEQARILNLYVLKTFYQTAYPKDPQAQAFYEEYSRRLAQAEATLGLEVSACI